jgi:hypothetical protein
MLYHARDDRGTIPAHLKSISSIRNLVVLATHTEKVAGCVKSPPTRASTGAPSRFAARFPSRFACRRPVQGDRRQSAAAHLEPGAAAPPAPALPGSRRGAGRRWAMDLPQGRVPVSRAGALGSLPRQVPRGPGRCWPKVGSSSPALPACSLHPARSAASSPRCAGTIGWSTSSARWPASTPSSIIWTATPPRRRSPTTACSASTTRPPCASAGVTARGATVAAWDACRSWPSSPLNTPHTRRARRDPTHLLQHPVRLDPHRLARGALAPQPPQLTPAAPSAIVAAISIALRRPHAKRLPAQAHARIDCAHLLRESACASIPIHSRTDHSGSVQLILSVMLAHDG